MRYIGKNNQLLDYFNDNHIHFTDGTAIKIDITLVDITIPKVEVSLFFMTIDCQKIQLKFSEILEYSFYHSRNYGFEIEYCKFFNLNNEFYISMDPNDYSNAINENDQDFILAKTVEGYIA